MNAKLLGANIVASRNKLNMTQERLAEQIDISNVFLSQIENGVRKPGLTTLIRLSQVLGVSIDRLLGLGVSEQEERLYGLHQMLGNATEDELNLIEDVCRVICQHLDRKRAMSGSSDTEGVERN